MNITCPNCGFSREIADKNLPPTAEMATCPKCEQKFQFRTLPKDTAAKQNNLFEATDQTGNPQIAAFHQHNQNTSKQKAADLYRENSSQEPQKDNFRAAVFPPWEDLQANGFGTAFSQTLSTVLFHPILFFQHLQKASGINKPLIFYLITVELNLILTLLLQNSNNTFIQKEAINQVQQFSPITVLVLYPFFFALSQFLVAGLHHFFLAISGELKKGYETTFRVVCYGSTPLLFSPIFTLLVPNGQFVTAIWTWICIAIGYKYQHSVGFVRAMFAVAIPVILAVALILSVLRSAANF